MSTMLSPWSRTPGARCPDRHLARRAGAAPAPPTRSGSPVASTPRPCRSRGTATGPPGEREADATVRDLRAAHAPVESGIHRRGPERRTSRRGAWIASGPMGPTALTARSAWEGVVLAMLAFNVHRLGWRRRTQLRQQLRRAARQRQRSGGPGPAGTSDPRPSCSARRGRNGLGEPFGDHTGPIGASRDRIRGPGGAIGVAGRGCWRDKRGGFWQARLHQ